VARTPTPSDARAIDLLYLNWPKNLKAASDKDDELLAWLRWTRRIVMAARAQDQDRLDRAEDDVDFVEEPDTQVELDRGLDSPTGDRQL
jgi:hypothetical protein